MSLKKGLSIFLLLSAAVSCAVLYSSVDTSSFDIFRSAVPARLAFAASLVVAVWLLDALKLWALTRAAGEQVSYAFALELTWINYFGAAITPMQSGGGPFQIYLMYRKGISVGKSVAITLTRTILTLLILVLTIPFGFLLQERLPEVGAGMRWFLLYIVVFCTIAGGAIVLSVVRPRLVKRAGGTLVVLLKRVGLLKPEWVGHILRRVSREIDSYNQNLWALLTRGRRYFLLAALLAVLQMIALLSVMPCMILAVGLPVNYLECILVQALFLFLLYFIPTPGGSGAAEGGAALVFRVFVPWSAAGVLGVGWRFLTEHTGIFMGMLVVLKMIGWGAAQQILTQSGDLDGAEEAARKEDAEA